MSGPDYLTAALLTSFPPALRDPHPKPTQFPTPVLCSFRMYCSLWWRCSVLLHLGDSQSILGGPARVPLPLGSFMTPVSWVLLLCLPQSLPLSSPCSLPAAPCILTAHHSLFPKGLNAAWGQGPTGHDIPVCLSRAWRWAPPVLCSHCFHE